MKLSATIITYNEERNIERCLSSLQGIADEIVIVDSFSTDDTERLTSAYNVRFIKHKFEGHIEQKNYAISQANGDWILSLDADEALDEDLRASILTVKSAPVFTGYKMNRLTNYCGHWVRHCGWYPDTKIRLVQKNAAIWKGINPHDRLDMLGNDAVGHLNGNILHYSYYTIADHKRQIEYFGDISARELFKMRRSISWLMIILKVLAQFIKSYFIKSGYKDGNTGFTISRLSAFATYRKYFKLKQLHREVSRDVN